MVIRAKAKTPRLAFALSMRQGITCHLNSAGLYLRMSLKSGHALPVRYCSDGYVPGRPGWADRKALYWGVTFQASQAMFDEAAHSRSEDASLFLG